MDKSVKEIVKAVLAEIRRAQASDTGAYGFSAVEREEIERHLAVYRNLKEMDEIMDKMQKDEISRLYYKLGEKLWENQALDAEIKRLREALVSVRLVESIEQANQIAKEALALEGA